MEGGDGGILPLGAWSEQRLIDLCGAMIAN